MKKRLFAVLGIFVVTSLTANAADLFEQRTSIAIPAFKNFSAKDNFKEDTPSFVKIGWLDSDFKNFFPK